MVSNTPKAASPHTTYTKVVSPHTTYTLLREHTIRFETIIYLAGALTAGANFPCSFGHLLNNEDDSTLLQVFPDFPLAMRDDCDRGELLARASDWLTANGKLGFAIQVATPVMSPHKVGKGCSLGWGHYYTRWVYADSLEEGVHKAIAWATTRREYEKTTG